MKKVVVVSKTHLDLGFTDFARNIKEKYINEFIPNAISIAKEVNNGNSKKFVWTTGSWILCEAIKHSNAKNRRLLIAALENGDIAPHALPFTLHTELLDYDTLEYGISLVKSLNKIKGSKTISAKMTDVPGHTKALLPLLYNNGIKLLHIGVNGASAIPDVPECFLWKNGNAQVVVIYSGDYGGEFRSEYLDDILYFDHTVDNRGAQGAKAVEENINLLAEKYPGYDIVAGTLDDFANKLWAVRDKLPVVTGEIGDSWIHGSAADPYKSACIRTLISFKNKWLANGSMKRNTREYRNLCNCILCLCEHTCGMDCKLIEGINDYYLKADFLKAQKSGRFTVIEESWEEQREYVTLALSVLSDEHREEVLAEINLLMPQGVNKPKGDKLTLGEKYSFKNSCICINEQGGIGSLVINNKLLIGNNYKSAVTFDCYNGQNYESWHKCYNRCIEQTKHWSLADFGRPNLLALDSKFKAGRYEYTANGGVINLSDKLTITVDLAIDRYCYDELGAPKKVQLIYTLDNEKLEIECIWCNKDISRLTQSIALHFYPDSKDVTYQKLGTHIDPFDVVYNGNRKLSAVEKIILDKCEIINHHSPLVSIGDGVLMNWDNEYGRLSDGISYILYDNVWGTNFPLWYGDNAYFKFTIK